MVSNNFRLRHSNLFSTEYNTIKKETNTITNNNNLISNREKYRTQSKSNNKLLDLNSDNNNILKSSNNLNIKDKELNTSNKNLNNKKVNNLEVNSNHEKEILTDNEKDTHFQKNLNNLLIEQIFYQKYKEKNYEVPLVTLKKLILNHIGTAFIVEFHFIYIKHKKNYLKII